MNRLKTQVKNRIGRLKNRICKLDTIIHLLLDNKKSVGRNSGYERERKKERYMIWFLIVITGILNYGSILMYN